MFQALMLAAVLLASPPPDEPPPSDAAPAEEKEPTPLCAERPADPLGSPIASTRGFAAMADWGQPVVPSWRTAMAGSIWGSFGSIFFGTWTLLLTGLPVTFLVGGFWATVWGGLAFWSVSSATAATGSPAAALIAGLVAGLLGVILGVAAGVAYSAWVVWMASIVGAGTASLVGMAVDTVERIVSDNAAPKSR